MPRILALLVRYSLDVIPCGLMRYTHVKKIKEERIHVPEGCLHSSPGGLFLRLIGEMVATSVAGRSGIKGMAAVVANILLNQNWLS
jgi:hypothetical protein